MDSRSARPTILRAALPAVLSLALCACQAREISHPTEANIVSDDKLTARIQVAPGPQCELSDLAARLRKAREVGAIPLEGRQAVAKLQRVDSVWAGSGEILFVDSQAQFVGIIGEAGAVRPMLDPQANRPAALEDVRRAIRVEDGRIVTMGRNGSAAIFKPTTAGYAFASSVPLGGRPEDTCSLGNDVYVRIPGARKLITRMTADGTIVNAFGEPYRIADKEIGAILSQGLLACVPGAQTIVTMFGTFPEIYGFDRDGAVRWISRFEDYRRPRLVEVKHPGHSMLVHSQPDVADRLWAMVPFESKYVIVQLLRFSPDTKKRPHEIHSYLLDATTGRGEYIGQTLPRLRATSGTTLYAEAAKPPLRVVVYSADAQSWPSPRSRKQP